MPGRTQDRTATAEPSEVQVRDRRFWAAVIDVWVLGWVLGIGAQAVVDVLLDITALGALVAFPLLAAAEARTGRTPGKALTGLRTQGTGGGPVGWRSASRRRSWMALPAVGFLPGVPVATGGFLLFVAAVALVLSMGRSTDGRGWHDRAAGAEVVASEGPRPSRPLLTLGVVGALLVVAVGWWFHTPEGGSTGFRSFPQAERISCDVTHDGWLYSHHEQRVTLLPGGEAFTGRFGPHDVTLAFVDETEGMTSRRGLVLEVATRSLGVTSGRSTGSDDLTIRTTTGPGLGELTIRCQPLGQHADT